MSRVQLGSPMRHQDPPSALVLQGPDEAFDYPRFIDIASKPDTGNGSAPIVDMGAYEFGSIPTAPLVCAADADTYIFPLAETCPLTSFSLEASESLTLNRVIATYTGAGPVPNATLVANEGGRHTVHLNPPPTPGEWLRLDMNVTSTGTGLTSDLTVFAAHQPLDFNCDGRSDVQDATAFGDVDGEIDLNCDGVVNLQDVTAFGNIWHGEAPATKAWRNTSLPFKPAGPGVVAGSP